MDLNFFGKTVGEGKATNIDKTADCIPGIRKSYLATQLHLSYAYSSLQNMPPGMWSSLTAYFPNLITKKEVPAYKHDLSMFYYHQTKHGISWSVLQIKGEERISDVSRSSNKLVATIHHGIG